MSPKSKKSKKMKGKQWFKLEAPEMFDKQDLGETVAKNADEIIGRRVEVGANAMTQGSSKYYYTLFLKVNDVQDGVGKCEYVGHKCSRDFITRMIRRRSKRVDDRTVVETKDGKKLVIKSVCATIKSVGHSKQTGIREKISSILKEDVSEMTLEEFLESILSSELQKKLKQECDKIYPLKEVEFKKTELVE